MAQSFFDKYILKLGQINLKILTNIFGNFDKYSLQVKQTQVIGLFTMGGQEVEQEVVLACVKDIIGEILYAIKTFNTIESNASVTYEIFFWINIVQCMCLVYFCWYIKYNLDRSFG